MNEQQIKDLAKRYYDFVLHYEGTLKADEKEVLKDFSPTQLKMYEAFKEMYVQEYTPWKLLSKGKELEELTEKFINKTPDLMSYLRISDLISEDFITIGMIELTNYYKEKNIDKTEDEIFEEVDKMSSSGNIDKNIFSKELINTYDLLKEIEPITEELQKYYYEKIDKELENDIDEIEK